MYHIGIGKHIGIFMETYHAYFYIFTSFLSKQYRDLKRTSLQLKERMSQEGRGMRQGWTTTKNERPKAAHSSSPRLAMNTTELSPCPLPITHIYTFIQRTSDFPSSLLSFSEKQFTWRIWISHSLNLCFPLADPISVHKGFLVYRPDGLCTC